MLDKNVPSTIADQLYDISRSLSMDIVHVYNGIMKVVDNKGSAAFPITALSTIFDSARANETQPIEWTGDSDGLIALSCINLQEYCEGIRKNSRRMAEKYGVLSHLDNTKSEIDQKVNYIKGCLRLGTRTHAIPVYIHLTTNKILFLYQDAVLLAKQHIRFGNSELDYMYSIDESIRERYETVGDVCVELGDITMHLERYTPSKFSDNYNKGSDLYRYYYGLVVEKLYNQCRNLYEEDTNDADS